MPSLGYLRRYVVVIRVAAILITLLATLARAEDRPNMVIILVDDMGFSDIGCYGSEIPTPNVDALAAAGLRFTQFYNTGRCCPTRASLLTGLYSHQTGIGHMTGDYGHPGYRGRLNNKCVTLADVAADAGYFTAVSGKWHVGAKKKSMWPLARGFQRSYVCPEGGGFYFQIKPGRSIVLNNEVVANMQNPLPEDYYTTDAWTEYGLKFIDEAIAAKKPFLLYLAHNAPHFPLQASAKDIAKFRGKYLAGWDALAKARYHRQIEMGLITESWQPAPRPERVAAWESLSDSEKDRFDHIMATYAACVYRMDRSVGELVAGLKARGKLDNTLILFMSDNGGCAESGPQGKSEGDPTTPDSNWFCGESWAWLQDTPFRKYKHYNHEGGIATPLIAHWPRGITDPGSFRTQSAHVIDIMATVTDLSGGAYPTKKIGPGGKREVAITPTEGKSLKPLFGDGKISRDALYWEHEGNAAIRVDDWKLVRMGGRGKWELYDMQNDRTEDHDLAKEHPDRVQQLAAQWRQWAQRSHVAPDGLPKGQKNKKPRVRKRREAASSL